MQGAFQKGVNIHVCGLLVVIELDGAGEDVAAQFYTVIPSIITP